jgi:hypothetical protein
VLTRDEARRIAANIAKAAGDAVANMTLDTLGLEPLFK